jgi:DNA-binding SARP family transcriptional activator
LHISIGESPESAPVAPKIRTVLATLVVNADLAVPVSALMREIWCENPPTSGLRTLQTYILNCRKTLAKLTGLTLSETARDVLVTRPNGYSFKSGAGLLDWQEFRRLSDLGRRAVEAREDAQAIRLLDGALSLWRGSAFADVPAGPVLEAQRRLFDEWRLGAMEALAEARLRIGLYQLAIADLAALTTEFPLHEGLHGQYMRALALSGRRARALEVFGLLRARLVEEIGIEPGRDLQGLQLAILNSHSEEA